MEGTGKRSIRASIKKSGKEFWSAERFSPKYFRNLGAGVVAVWVGTAGVAQNVLSEEQRMGYGVNPVPILFAINAYVSEDECKTSVTEAELLTILNKNSKEVREFSSFDVVHELAERNGLEVVSSAKYTEQLKTTKTIEQVTNLVNDYTTSAHGFKTTITNEATSVLRSTPSLIEKITHEKPQNGFYYDFYDEHVWRENNFKLFINGAHQLLKQIEIIPRELIELSKLEELVIKSPLDDSRTIGYVKRSSNKINITVRGIEASNSGGVFAHELGHLLDKQICGRWGMNRDKVYANHNSFGFEYGDFDSLAINNNVSSLYGATSPIEDKAELLALLLGGTDGKQLNSFPEPLKQKSQLLLARLEHHVPGISNYLTQLAKLTGNKYDPKVI